LKDFIARHKTAVSWLWVLLALFFARTWLLVIVAVSVYIWIDDLKPPLKKQ
jgi:hypothetical protein